MLDPFDPHGESRRRALFAALVASQDRGLAVRASRAFVASRFDVTAADVARVEREGLDAQWPPLWPGGTPEDQPGSQGQGRDAPHAQ